MSPVLDAAMHHDLVRAIYDDRAESYEDSWHPEFVNDFLGLIADPPMVPGDRVLDLACGTGLVTHLAALRVGPHGFVIGIDMSERMLAVARRKVQELPQGQAAMVTFVQHAVDELSSIDELDGLEGTFDIITCASALVLLRRPKDSLQHWARYLKPRTGRLVVDVPDPRDHRGGVVLETAAAQSGVSVPYNRGWIKDMSSLEDALEQAGELKVEKIVRVAQGGVKRRLYDAGAAEASKVFDRIIAGSLNTWFSVHNVATRESLKHAFIEVWAAAGNTDGKVEEVDSVYIAVARRY